MEDEKQINITEQIVKNIGDLKNMRKYKQMLIESITHISEQSNNKISGKLALIENAYHGGNVEAVLLIFEWKGSVYESVINDILSINQIKVGQSMAIDFDDRSIVSFKESVQSRAKGMSRGNDKTKVKIGTFSGYGHLEYVDGNDLEFTSSILPGKWEIRNESGSGFFSKREQVIRRLK